MKIDLIITELAVGGAEQCLTNLAIFLQSRSHNVRVVVLAAEPPEDRARLRKQLDEHEIDVVFLGGTGLWNFPRTWWKLHRLIRRSRPELAQAFLFHANTLAALTYPIYGLPLVAGARVVDPRRWRRWINWITATWTTRLVCVSQSVALHSRNIDMVAERKIVVISNGIAPEESDDGSHRDQASAQKQLGLSPATPLLLFVGRLDHQKGIDVLVERADALLNALPLYQLVIVGDGPMKIEAQTRASKCKNETRIHFVGRREDVRRWMQSSRLLLLPTRYEGMPNVVLEAMSCGLPVVTTRAEGIRELLGDAADEQTVPVGDWDAWEALTVHLASSPKLHQKLSQENLERCRREFDLEDKMEQYLELYESLLPQPKAMSRERFLG